MDSLEHARLTILNAGLALHDADWDFEDVCSPFTRIYCVTEGRAGIRFDSGVQEVKRGYLYMIPAFVRHSYLCDSRFGHYYLHIYDESERNFPDEWIFPPEIPAGPMDGELFHRLCGLCPEMALEHADPRRYDNDSVLTRNLQRNHQMDIGRRMEMRGIVYQLFSRFMPYARPRYATQDGRIRQVLAYIRERMDRHIDIGELSAVSFLSHDHLIRLFRQETGQTPIQYINSKKMERAQLRLITRSASVREISQQLGYEDSSYFCRLFKRLVGMTPQEYREAHPSARAAR